MSSDNEGLQITEQLCAIGQVEQPAARVLDDARERLWSAIADEMLDSDLADRQTRSTGSDEHGRTARRRQQNRPQNIERRLGN
jgi:hypothetical protein